MASSSSADLHFFDSLWGSHLLVVDGTRIYDIDEESRSDLESAISSGLTDMSRELATRGLGQRAFIDDRPLEDPPLRSISLAIAQKCNLACGYCYAQGGSFGGEAKAMTWAVAKAAIDSLLAASQSGAKVHVGYIGGEPLVNRALLRQTTEYAVREGGERGVRVGFSVTTNGTLVDLSDGEFFNRFGFAVTVSIDGVGEAHDQLRPFRSGQGSYGRIISRLKPLLAMQDRMQIGARVTVTPLNLNLLETLDNLVGLGFHDVGFAPTITSTNPQLELSERPLQTMLERMIECGKKFEFETIAGRRYPFSNLASALKEIHRGTHRPYPCGAAAGYLGVSADGRLYSCHRFVEDPKALLGDLFGGIDRIKRNQWLADRHVHRQEPCKTCWARYMCGGGCHHEVIKRGRFACDYVRGWLHYCLSAYVNLYEKRPDWFGV